MRICDRDRLNRLSLSGCRLRGQVGARRLGLRGVRQGVGGTEGMRLEGG